MFKLESKKQNKSHVVTNNILSHYGGVICPVAAVTILVIFSGVWVTYFDPQSLSRAGLRVTA